MTIQNIIGWALLIISMACLTGTMIYKEGLLFTCIAYASAAGIVGFSVLVVKLIEHKE